jgi:purine-nucleoside phosphorylase
MAYGMKEATEAAEFLRENGADHPLYGLLTGTGLGDSVRDVKPLFETEYRNVPHMPASTVSGHDGRLVIGRLEGRGIVVFRGRFHLYEGYTPSAVTFPIRVLQLLGIRRLILTNASGGLNPAFRPGEIMIIRDHINLTGANPLVGPNIDAWGPRFPDMSIAYDREMADTGAASVPAGEVPLRQGVYAGLRGPSLETPAEVRFLRTIGADAVGFSTVQEVIAAVHGGMRVLGLAILTNVHDPDRPAPAGLEEILQVAAEAAPRLGRLIREVVAATG